MHAEDGTLAGAGGDAVDEEPTANLIGDSERGADGPPDAPIRPRVILMAPTAAPAGANPPPGTVEDLTPQFLGALADALIPLAERLTALESDRPGLRPLAAANRLRWR